MKFQTNFDIGSTVYCIVENNGPPFVSQGKGVLDNGAFRVNSIEVAVYWDTDMNSLQVHVSYWVLPRMHPSMTAINVREYNAFPTLKDAREAYAAL